MNDTPNVNSNEGGVNHLTEAFNKLDSDINTGNLQGAEGSTGNGDLAPDTNHNQEKAQAQSEQSAIGEAIKTRQQSTTDKKTTEQKIKEILDLNSLEKFKIGDQEFTPQQLKEAMLFKSDYTRKTQQLAEERKGIDSLKKEQQYRDNLMADLDHVKQHPQLASQFMQIYPKSFHKFLDLVGLPRGFGQRFVDQGETEEQQTSQPTTPTIPDELRNELNSIKEWKSSLEAKEYQTLVEASDKQLAAWETKFTDKYPEAELTEVYSALDAALAKGEITYEQVTEKTMETIFKQSHDRITAKFDKYQAKKLEQQKRANREGEDIGKGGMIPGAEPRTPKTLKEANEMLERDIAEGRI